MTLRGFLFLCLPEYLAKLLRHKRTAASRRRVTATIQVLGCCRGRISGSMFRSHLLFQSLDVLRGRGASAVLLAALLEFCHRLQTRSDPGVHHMTPVTFAARWQALEALHQQHAGIADLTLARHLQLEAFDKVDLVTFRVGETGTETSE